MDSYGDHALVCDCKGDRTVRHNAVRNTVFGCAKDACLSPEKEKAGLLPARPREDGIDRASDSARASASRRRPADVFLPRGFNGAPMALDFAVTSGIQASFLRQSAGDASVVLATYERQKRDFTAPGKVRLTAPKSCVSDKASCSCQWC